MLQHCRQAAITTLLLGALPALLGGCSSLLSESASAGAGIGGAAIAHGIGANGAVTAGIGIGAQAATMAGVQYLQRRIHKQEQDAIAITAGALAVGQVAPWQINSRMPIEGEQRGQVTVSRLIATPPATDPNGLDCKEIVFSVDTVEKDVPQRAFYTAAVCRDGTQWRWATAEPATERWGALQ